MYKRRGVAMGEGEGGGRRDRHTIIGNVIMNQFGSSEVLSRLGTYKLRGM